MQRGRKQKGSTRTSPGGHRARRVAPVETDCLLDHVLLLAAVAGTNQQARHVVGGQLHQLVHGQRAWRVDKAVDSDGVLVPAQPGDGSVVAHKVQANGRHEALGHGQREGGLHVERMAAGQTNECRVSGDPAVSAISVSSVRTHQQPTHSSGVRWSSGWMSVGSSCKCQSGLDGSSGGSCGAPSSRLPVSAASAWAGSEGDHVLSIDGGVDEEDWTTADTISAISGDGIVEEG